jgi:hypothetical protein
MKTVTHMTHYTCDRCRKTVEQDHLQGWVVATLAATAPAATDKAQPFGPYDLCPTCFEQFIVFMNKYR